MIDTATTTATTNNSRAPRFVITSTLTSSTSTSFRSTKSAMSIPTEADGDKDNDDGHAIGSGKPNCINSSIVLCGDGIVNNDDNDDDDSDDGTASTTSTSSVASDGSSSSNTTEDEDDGISEADNHVGGNADGSDGDDRMTMSLSPATSTLSTNTPRKKKVTFPQPPSTSSASTSSQSQSNAQSQSHPDAHSHQQPPMHHIHNIPSRHEYTSEEVDRCFYNQTEYQRIRNDCYWTVVESQNIASTSRRYQQDDDDDDSACYSDSESDSESTTDYGSRSTSTSSLSTTMSTSSQATTLRGLEGMFPNTYRRRTHRIKRSIQAVMHMQTVHGKSLLSSSQAMPTSSQSTSLSPLADMEMVAQAYGSTTKAAMELAHQRGLSDEQCVSTVGVHGVSPRSQLMFR